MRCETVRGLGSAYIDGELDDRRASALRGHLRTCQGCREEVEDLATIRDTAYGLEPIEPPPSLWAKVEEGLARAEIADSNRSWLWLRWQALRPYLLPGAVAACAALVLILWLAQRIQQESYRASDHAGQLPGDRQVARAETTAEFSAEAAAVVGPGRDGETEAGDFAAERAEQIAAADSRYLATITDLRQLVAEERAEWPAKLSAAFDARLSELERAARTHRRAAAGNRATEPRARDALYAVYRAEIAFLQTAVIDGVVALDTQSPAPRGLPK